VDGGAEQVAEVVVKPVQDLHVAAVGELPVGEVGADRLRHTVTTSGDADHCAGQVSAPGYDRRQTPRGFLAQPQHGPF